VVSVYDRVHRLCAGYACEGEPDFAVETTLSDVGAEREYSARTDKNEGRETIDYPDDYLETLAVYRKIAEIMPGYGVMLFHGSCVSADGEGYIFTAKSGTGKSTHARLWLKLLGERAFIVNDDKPLIRVSGGKATVYGTPYSGKHHADRNVSVPLRGICLLSQAKENSVARVPSAEAFAALLAQTYHPSDPKAMAETIELAAQMCSGVPVFRLECNTELDAARICFEAMRSADP